MGRERERQVIPTIPVGDASGALGEIAQLMSRTDWDGELGNAIADILHRAGVPIPEPDPGALPPARCPKCGGSHQLRVLETYIVRHRYKAHEHVAVDRTPEISLDDGEEDYRAACSACGHEGTLADFKMALEGWEADDDGDE